MTAPPAPSTTPAGAPSDRTVHRLLDEWRTADLITPDQVDAIEAFHHDQHREAEQSRSFGRMVAVASSLGAVLVGAGILLVVASNWGSLSALAKTMIAIAGFVFVEVIGYTVRFRTGYRRSGEAFLLVGVTMYGGAVFLVAQAYHRPLNDPNLFLFWLLPTLPMAYAVRSRLVTALAILVTFGVVGYRLPDWLPGDWHTALLAVLTAYLMLGAACLAIGGVHRDLRPVEHLAPPWEWLGTVAILLMQFVASFRGIDLEAGNRWISRVSGALLAIIVICGVVTATGVVVRTALRRRFEPDVVLIASVAGLAVATSVFLITDPFTADNVSFALRNVLLLTTLIALLLGGTATGRQSLVNVALVAFAVTVFVRYLEIGAGMLGTGMGMVVGGLLLIGIGVALERFRRRLVARMREEAAS